MHKEISVKSILELLERKGISYQFLGDKRKNIAGFCSFYHQKSGCITWIKDLKKVDRRSLNETKDMLYVCKKEETAFPESDNRFLLCKNPKLTFFSILSEFFAEKGESRRESTAIVETSTIGERCYIGHHTYIGKEVVIGNDVVIWHNVTIQSPARIGDHTIIWPGTVIGADGFGYSRDDGQISRKVPHFGGVRIGKYVEIGANVCIDRGTIDDTVIGDYVKIDNLSQIAHNVVIEEKANIVSAKIAGSCHIGANAYIGPGSVIKNQLSVGRDSFVGMSSAVIRNVKENRSVFGCPAAALERTYDI